MTAAGKPPARLLDLTRLLSRAGRGLTGVDRVERAYLSALTTGESPCFALLRSSAGYLLLDRAGMVQFAARLAAQDWGQADMISRLARRLPPVRQAAEARARALAIARCLPVGLPRMLRRSFPDGLEYYNTGHSNLTDRVLQAISSVPGARISVLVHDTIPLDYPDWQKDGTVPAFAAKLARVSRFADKVICTTNVVRGDLERHLAAMGRVPPITVAPLGIDPVEPDPAALPPGLDLLRPTFLCLGTIEPRKNHRLLLDLWESLSPGAATLIICGARGWRNEDVFARLDARPRDVVELSGLSDGAVAAIMTQARALLFPSHAEGFGLPLAEAAALGLPVICNDLPVCREVLGTAGIYVEVTDRYAWEKQVRAAILQRPSMNGFVAPTWERHFKTTLSLT